MNERIVELRKEAWRQVQVDLQTNERDEPVTDREHTKMVFDKFAELIVAECISVVNNKGEYFNTQSNKWQMGCRIKEHFGV